METTATKLQARAYQLEMFEESMKRNIIVAMATGLGKTNIASLRVRAELERSPTKRVWFTAPNTILAEQQHYFLSSQLPEYQMRTLLGHDKVDLWRTPAIWDSALADMHVVVSTPQVLLDALRNAFVQLERISLLVVDEAHHCQAGDPSARLMSQCYHPLKQRNPSAVPHILGLTASSRISNKTASTKDLESTLDAVCCMPTVSLPEYASHVYKPEVVGLPFTPVFHQSSQVLATLTDVAAAALMCNDPYYKTLKTACDQVSAEKLRKVEKKGSTPAIREVKSLLNNASYLESSLGSWASDCFVRSCVDNWHRGLVQDNVFHESMNRKSMTFVDELLSPLRGIFNANQTLTTPVFSTKAQVLVDFLASEYHKGIAIIIFVERRSTAYALSELLSATPQLCNYRIFSFVGLASCRYASLVDLADRRVQKQAFADFRSGSQDICVATSVAEEGIDIQAVNLVIRYDDPKQFVSHVQSRGRARKEKSKYVYFRDLQAPNNKYLEWGIFEQQLEQEYQKDEELRKAAVVSNDLDEDDGQKYAVPTTGAILVHDNSMQHLQHFCTVISGGMEPIYILSGTLGESVTAKVILPSSVPSPLQEATSTRAWFGERAAKRDAAFQAYRALHEAGLVTDHLVPIQPEKSKHPQPRHGHRQYEICAEFDVWHYMLAEDEPFNYLVRITRGEENYANLITTMPYRMCQHLSFTLCESASRQLDVTIQPLGSFPRQKPLQAKSVTKRLVETAFRVGSASESFDDPNRLPLLLLPESCFDEDRALETSSLQNFLMTRSHLCHPQPLLVWKAQSQTPHLWHAPRSTKVPGNTISEILATKVSKLQVYTAARGADTGGSSTATLRTLATNECQTRGLATTLGPSILLLPSILHFMAAAMRAEHAQNSVLKAIEFMDASLLTQALISNSASGLFNYERMEFLGDAYLKFRTSFSMFSDNPLATEGVLTMKVHEVINNHRLEQAIQTSGMEKYITTQVAAQKHWKLPATNDKPEGRAQRKVNSKTLADAVESILGAAFIDGSRVGLADERCTAVLELFLPEIVWLLPREIVDAFLAQRAVENPGALTMAVESMLCYRFQRLSLLHEAFTHSSLLRGQSSLDRLEFLGDAIVDQIVKVRLFKWSKLSAYRMTICRAALVSHALLAYYALSLNYVRERNELHTRGENSVTVEQVQTVVYATDMIQFYDAELQKPIQVARTRFETTKNDIEESLRGGVFPWAILQRLNAPKVCSDIIESLIAAIYLDSRGSLVECEKMLDRLGMLTLLDKMADNDAFEVRTPSARLHEVCAQRHLAFKFCSTKDEVEMQYVGKVLITGPNDEQHWDFVGPSASCDAEARSSAAETALRAILAGECNVTEAQQTSNEVAGSQEVEMTGVDDEEMSEVDGEGEGGVIVCQQQKHI
ncbi:Dicer-like protein 2 [Lithohypha guttulata]|uniref:Dicer-like protein 2 n=1 Tax=Lithohypha guttulata TaxID=1690604 RepID=UPI002DE1649F|nr:Dicer-like protein 2 [Lithohypha guttulata]